MRELAPADLARVVARIPQTVKAQMLLGVGLMVAGGFIRDIVSGEEPKDIDLFRVGSGDVLSTELAARMSTTAKLHTTPRAVTVLDPADGEWLIQIITKNSFTDPKDHIGAFDFTVCQAAVWREGGYWNSEVSDGFYPDLAAKRLVFTNPDPKHHDSLNSVRRAIKFSARGYTILDDSLSEILAAVFTAKFGGKERNDQGVMAGILQFDLGEIGGGES